MLAEPRRTYQKILVDCGGDLEVAALRDIVEVRCEAALATICWIWFTDYRQMCKTLSRTFPGEYERKPSTERFREHLAICP